MTLVAEGLERQGLPLETQEIPVRIYVVDAQAAGIAEGFRDASAETRKQTPYSFDEKEALEGVLRFVDYCVTSYSYNHRPGRAVRRARAMAKRVEGLESPMLDHDDVVQEARLRVVGSLRRFNASRGPSAFGVVAHDISSGLRLIGANELLGGLTVKRGHKLSDEEKAQLELFEDEAEVDGPARWYSALRTGAFTARHELGYSDALEELKRHPHYRTHVPQEDRVDPEVTSAGKAAPITPRYDYSITYELDPDARSIDRVLAVAEECGLVFTDRQWEILRMRYEQGMTQSEVAVELGVFRQSIQASEVAVLNRIRKVPRAMELLQDLVETA